MKLKKITKQQAYAYINAMGDQCINIDGFLTANPLVDEIYSDEKNSGLLCFCGDYTVLHSSNEEFLSCAYDFVPDTAFFSCINKTAADFLTRTKNTSYREYCHILAYKKPTAPIFEVPQGLTVKNIDIKDLPLINELYTYKSEHSLDRLKHEISSRPSCALYDGEQILAWNLLHDDYSLGVMYVPQQNRGKGYAQIVAAALMTKVINQNMTPYVQVVSQNTASLCLAKKLGFEKIFEACWFGKHGDED